MSINVKINDFKVTKNMSINKVILLGNVGKEPDIKKFDNGGAIANFTIATTKKAFKTKAGKEIAEHTEWHNVQFGGGLAQVVEKYLHKGDKVYVEGELRTREYEKDGQKKYITEIIGNNLELCGGKKSDKEEKEDDGMPF